MGGVNMNQCDRIKIILQENKLKQKQLASELGVTESYISKLLKDPNIRLSQSLASLIEEKYGYNAGWVLNNEEPKLINEELLVSPRIDNITSVEASLESFLESKENNINVFCTFNSEEIGSLTKEGADSNFLMDTLKKIAASLKIDISTSLYQSFIISSDNTHAIHPNHPDLGDTTNKTYLNEGIVISKEIDSTTDALSSSIFKQICQKAKVPYQDSTSRNDMTTGSTLSGISLRHVSVTSIDIGLAQLAMHSSIECIGKNDVYNLYQAFLEFYQTTLKKEKKNTKLTY